MAVKKQISQAQVKPQMAHKEGQPDWQDKPGPLGETGGPLMVGFKVDEKSEEDLGLAFANEDKMKDSQPKSQSEQAIIQSFIDFIIEKEDYSTMSRAKLNQLSLKELSDEAKNIIERINKEQEESEQLMQSKLTGQNHQVSEKISGFINTHIEMSKCKFI